MKSILLSLAILISAACLAHAVPRMTVDQAGALAQKELKDRGLDGHYYVVSLVMAFEGVMNKERYWMATWSQGIPADADTRKIEIGMRINMDGSTLRVVEGPASMEALTKPSRTRADRPSIVDLKH